MSLLELRVYSGVGSETETYYGLRKHTGREHCSTVLELCALYVEVQEHMNNSMGDV